MMKQASLLSVRWDYGKTNRMELQGQILGNQNRKIKTMERNEISNMYQKKTRNSEGVWNWV